MLEARTERQPAPGLLLALWLGGVFVPVWLLFFVIAPLYPAGRYWASWVVAAFQLGVGLWVRRRYYSATTPTGYLCGASGAGPGRLGRSADYPVCLD